ncbi:uncharacterized protein LOC109862949 isoform X3 [Pseudomyrmex gracilis]|uniref:uncharacterized protein LOC109862949 isoform X3 n=1 Tax=Pseudomyrmex gracilis TaxID=219809 RepID=UPI000995D90A|nr:uncharacterized protein LOC109862949 isoform X3 [Pseudomyrmex gracilis]
MATTMEQITLIDAETNIEYKLVISTEDAKKARNDHVFAHSLLEHAKRNTNVDVVEKLLSQSENIDNTNEITPCSSETDSSVEVKDYA